MLSGLPRKVKDICQEFRRKPTDTIMVLKAKILESQGFSISQQRIIFKGKQLEDEKTLCDYGVEDKNSLIMALRLIN